MALRTLSDLGNVAGQRVIVRCDLNVPLKDGVIIDDGRIRASIPTILTLANLGARVIIVSHLGRPEGNPDAALSLRPIAFRLQELVERPVAFASETVGNVAAEAVDALGDGDILVLENLRFNAGETAKDDVIRNAFAIQLAELADAMVSDGFGVVHRKQASVYNLAKLIPCAAGLLIEAELRVLDTLTENPERPYTVVLGGSKVSDKLGVIDHLLPRVDRILVGGGMVFTFFAALGYRVGASLLEVDQISTVQRYLEEAAKTGVEIVLPTDIVVAARFASDADHVVAASDALEETPFGESGIGLDIGPDSGRAFARIIETSRTVFWNGPAGVFEFPAFSDGTHAIAEALTRVNGLSVVGGGDSAAAVRVLGFRDDQFGHISTGGGASLEFLEGKNLPGLEVLGW